MGRRALSTFYPCMTAYQALAEVYDRFMGDGPQRAWLQWLQSASGQGLLPALAALSVADVGCGTGTLTTALAKVCPNVVGVDLSEDMLSRAAQTAIEMGVQVRFLCQDVRDLRLPFQPDLILSTCDCFNYLLEESDWEQALSSVARNLKPGGWFCFDVLGPSRIERLANGLWHEITDEAVVLYETRVAANGRIQYDVHAFLQNERTTLYQRIEESHEQQYMDSTRIASLVTSHGFRIVDLLGDFGQSLAHHADRLIFIAKRCS